MEGNRKVELLDVYTQLRGSAEVAIFQVASLPFYMPIIDKDFNDAVCSARYALHVLRLSMSYLNGNSAFGTANTAQYGNGMCALASTSHALPNSTSTPQSFSRENQQQQQSDQSNSSGLRCITSTPVPQMPAVDFPTEIQEISRSRISGSEEKPEDENNSTPLSGSSKDMCDFVDEAFAQEVLQPTTAAQVVEDYIEFATSLPCQENDIETHAKEMNPNSAGPIEPESQDKAVMVALSSGRILRPRRVIEAVIAEPVSKIRKRKRRPKSSSKKQAFPACGPGKKTALGIEKSSVRNHLALERSPAPKVSLSAMGGVNIYLAGVSRLVPIFFNNGFTEPYGGRKTGVCMGQYVLFDSERFRPRLPFPQDLSYCTTVSADRRSKLYHRYYWGEKWTSQHSELVDLLQSRSLTPTLSSFKLKQGECVKFLNEEETVAEVRRRYGIKMR